MLTTALALVLLASSPDPMGDLQRARAAVAAGDLEGAAKVLADCVQATPGWGLAHIDYADVLLKLGGQAPELEGELATARQLAPDNPRTWLLTGQQCELKGDGAAAIEAFAKAVELRPEMIEAREKLAAALAQADRWQEARPHFQAVSEARPEERTARANLAEALERCGDLAGAESLLRALADQDSGGLFRRRLVRFYERTGQAAKAVAEGKKLDAGRPPKKMRALPPSGR